LRLQGTALTQLLTASSSSSNSSSGGGGGGGGSQPSQWLEEHSTESWQIDRQTDRQAESR